MLAAIIAMYSDTESIIGSTVMSATQGVRQGSPTSCFLFIVFVNELIRSIKESCQPENFIEWLHILMLMDDTVLLSTSRETMSKKLSILNTYCRDFGMKVNNEKTKFFVINGQAGDAEPFHVDDLIVEQCTHYMYLGSPFTSDGSVSSAIKIHAKNKLPHVLKFVSFLKKNNDVPFIVKRRVFDVVLMSSLMYGCESWLGADIKPVIKLYNWALKQLLGVRKTTPNIVCYAESGYPSLPDLVKSKQQKFFKSMWSERGNMDDDPLAFTLNKVIAANTPTGRYVENLIHDDEQGMDILMDNVRNLIRESVGSRCNTYKDINPTLETLEIYTKKHSINELHRLEFTRFRVSGHSLAREPLLAAA